MIQESLILQEMVKQNQREMAVAGLSRTRTTTFIIANLKKSDDQTNTDKYRVAANIYIQHIIFYQN